MQDVKALLLDLSGVLYEGNRPIDGACATLDWLRTQNLTLRFVTNTATKSHQQILTHLQKMGFDLHAEELFTAPRAAHQYIQQQGLHPYCLIHTNLDDEFADFDQSEPDCVLLGDARDKLTYDNLNRAFQLCKQGAPLIGLGKNKYFKEKELMLDAGAFVHAIEWASDISATIMGKPNAAFYQQVVTSTGFLPEQCLMIGDDVASDVIGALDAGLQACLVKTGKYLSGDEAHCQQRAKCIGSISDVASLLSA